MKKNRGYPSGGNFASFQWGLPLFGKNKKVVLKHFVLVCCLQAPSVINLTVTKELATSFISTRNFGVYTVFRSYCLYTYIRTKFKLSAVLFQSNRNKCLPYFFFFCSYISLMPYLREMAHYPTNRN